MLWNIILVSHQNWLVPTFIKMFNHLKMWIDLSPIIILWQAVPIWDPLVLLYPRIVQSQQVLVLIRILLETSLKKISISNKEYLSVLKLSRTISNTWSAPASLGSNETIVVTKSVKPNFFFWWYQETKLINAYKNFEVFLLVSSLQTHLSS